MAKITNLDAYIAHLPGVTGAVRKYGTGAEARARADLATHRDTGAAKIEGRMGDTDYTISLVDKAALSIEFGHFTPDRDRYVGGLYILHRAIGV